MNAHLECLPCLARNAVDLAQRSTDDPVIRKKIVAESLHLLAEHSMAVPPPYLFSKLQEIAEKHTGKKNLYREEKLCYNRMAQRLVENLPSIPEYDPDSFESRIRMAVAGNIIDFGVFSDLDIAQAIQLIRDSFSREIDLAAARKIKERMDSAKTILYLLDNCGEAVFDRIFIEPYREKTIIGVRGGNVINDVTEDELKNCGLDGFAKGFISNGSATIPGTMIEQTSPEFQEVFQSADLIIAKGQGNFETLNESDRPIAFLFLSKCPVVARLLNTKIKEIQIRTINF